MEGKKLNSNTCHNCGARPSKIFILHQIAWGLSESPRVCNSCLDMDSDELAKALCQKIGGFVMLTQRRSLADELFRLKTGRA